MRRASLFRHFPAAAALVAAGALGVGCPCSGYVNDSPELRWWLFSNFGASKVCPEMLKRGVPLKLTQLGPASVGRFFPAQCQVQIDDNAKTMVVTMNGTGYATLPFTRRIGFGMSMSVEYRPDFKMGDDAIWVFGTFSRFVVQPNINILGVENAALNLATQTPLGNMATVIATGVAAGEIGKGFTVVKNDDDSQDFAVGHLDPPAKPPRQFVAGEGHVVMASDLTEVHAASRDYLGPFEVAASGAALFFHTKVTGGPIVYTIVEKSIGDQWRNTYQTGSALGAPPGVVVGSGTIAAGEANLAFPVNPGQYYLVVENQAAAPYAPLGIPMGTEVVSDVSYSAEVGDRQ